MAQETDGKRGEETLAYVIPAQAGILWNNMAKTFWVYILASKPHGVLYVGVTSNLIQRIYQHQTSAADGFTKEYHVKRLVYFEECPDAESAIIREKRIKKWYRSMKVDLIEKQNPLWEDLYPSLVGNDTIDKIPAFAGMTGL